MTRRRFDLIAFDWDGTLFDSTALIARCIQAACADVGAPVPGARDASFVIGMGLVEALQHAAPSLPRERYRELAERYRHHYFAQQHEVVLFDGTVSLLASLKQREFALAVATGKSRRAWTKPCPACSSRACSMRPAPPTKPLPNPTRAC
jgi:phosphoglycolate phosphatase